MENEYNKRFKNKEMSNDDFDVDGLWDDIADELDAPSDDTPISPWLKLGGGLVLLLVLAGIGLALFYSSNNNVLAEKDASSAKINTMDSEEKTIEGNSDLSINSIKNEEGSLSQTDKTNSISHSIQDLGIDDKNVTAKSKNQASNSKNNYSPKNTTDRNTPSNAFDTNNSGIIDEKSKNISTKDSTPEGSIAASNPEEDDVTNDETTGKSIKEKISSQSPNKNEADKKIIPPPPPFLLTPINELLGFTPTISDSLLYVGIRELPKKKVTEHEDERKKIAFEAGIYGGMNSTFVKFNASSDATYANARDATESPVSGSTYGVQMGVSYKGWRANTGIEFNNIWTKFDSEIKIDTTAFIPQALSLVVIDSIGNTINQISQDTTVNATTIRTIAHYNNFQMWSIPLEIGRYRAGRKWAYGFSAGTSFNFLTNQSGKILNTDNQLLGFDKNADNVLFQSFSMSLRANLMLGYKLRENVMVTVRPQWNWTRSNVFNNSLKADIHQANLTLGLRAIF